MGQDIYMEWDSNGAELLHTPGGVQDIYGVMCANKLKIQSAVHEVLSSYGFRDIQTPAFEYFDIFSKERGTVLQSIIKMNICRYDCLILAIHL